MLLEQPTLMAFFHTGMIKPEADKAAAEENKGELDDMDIEQIDAQQIGGSMYTIISRLP